MTTPSNVHPEPINKHAAGGPSHVRTEPDESDGPVGPLGFLWQPDGYFKPSFFLATSSAIDSRMRRSLVSGSFAIWIQTT